VRSRGAEAFAHAFSATAGLNPTPPSPLMPDAWSGVVLAGGRSSRMGRDKAFLVIEGQTLISRQVALLRAADCDDVLISGRAGVNYAVTGARVVYDSGEGLGPLSGIVAAFSAMKHDRLVVLAVDLPAMTTALLQRLLRTGTPVKCTVPHGRHGF